MLRRSRVKVAADIIKPRVLSHNINANKSSSPRSSSSKVLSSSSSLRRVVNPFTGRIIISTSSVFKLLEKMGLKFIGSIDDGGDAKNKQNELDIGSSSSSFSSGLSVYLDDPTKFPFTHQALEKYPPVATALKWQQNEDTFLSNTSKTSRNKKNKPSILVGKKKLKNNNNGDMSAASIDPAKVNQLEQYLSRGAEFWCKSIMYPSLLIDDPRFSLANCNTSDLISSSSGTASSHTDEIPAKNNVISKQLARKLNGENLQLPQNEDAAQVEQENKKNADSPLFSVLSPSSREHLLSSNFTLTKDQEAVLELARRGHNLYIGGYAGVGKSTALRRIAVELSTTKTTTTTTTSPSSSSSSRSVAVTATTGISALNIGGQTFHRIFQPNDPFTKFDKPALVKYDKIIIDEISMFTASMLESFERACREARPWAAHCPFGGIQVILSGDFMQLHVEQKDFNWSSRAFIMSGAGGSIPMHVQQKAKALNDQILSGSAHESRHAFESSVFQKYLLPVCLVTKMRHQGDPVLAKCLDELRFGRVAKQFLSRCFEVGTGASSQLYQNNNHNNVVNNNGNNNNQNCKDLIITDSSHSQRLVVPSVENCIYLFPTRKASDYHNELCLDRLSTESRIFEPKRVVLSLNGDWCSPVSTLATLNLDPVLLAKENFHDQNDHLQPHSSDLPSSSSASSSSLNFFRTPKNANSIRKQILHDFIFHKLGADGSNNVKGKKQKQILQLAAEKLHLLAAKNKTKDELNKTVRVRPGSRISLPSAQHVEVRLKQKIVEEMMNNDPKLFSKEPIVVHVDYNKAHKNSAAIETQKKSSALAMRNHHHKKNDSGFLGGCQNQLTNGISLDKESTTLPVNIRIKKTESNSLSLDKLKEKMHHALVSLTRKGFIHENNNNSNNIHNQNRSKFDESIYDNDNDTYSMIKNKRQQQNLHSRGEHEPKSTFKKPDWESFLMKNHNKKSLPSTPSSQLHAHHNNNNNNSNKELSGSTPDRDVTTPRLLKVGARVMLIRNISPTLVNGSTGVILSFDDEETVSKDDLPKGLFRESFVARRFVDADGNNINNSNSSSRPQQNGPESNDSEMKDSKNNKRNNNNNNHNNESSSPSLLLQEDCEFDYDVNEDDDDGSIENKENGVKNSKTFTAGLLDKRTCLPRVRFDNGEQAVIPFFPEMVIGNPSSGTNAKSFNKKNSGSSSSSSSSSLPSSSLSSSELDFSNSRISFMPLKVAFSTTVHKLQGSTVATAPLVLDLMRSWKCDHLVYVAASRVQKLEQLFILNWHQRHISVNEKAKKFSEGLKSSEVVLREEKRTSKNC